MLQESKHISRLFSTLACYLEDNTDWHTEADRKFTRTSYEVDSLNQCRRTCKQFGYEYFTWEGPKEGRAEGPCYCNTGTQERKNAEGFYSGKTEMVGKCLDTPWGPCTIKSKYTYLNILRYHRLLACKDFCTRRRSGNTEKSKKVCKYC